MDRMEYWYEKYNQFPTFVLGQQSQVFPQAPLGVVYPTDNNVLNTIAPSKYKFAPRIGIAWSPNKSDGVLGKLLGGPGKAAYARATECFIRWCPELRWRTTCRKPRTGASRPPHLGG